jgi:hypothetical protein
VTLAIKTGIPADDVSEGLPEGWTLTTLGDACEINPPKAPKDSLPADAPVTFVPMPAVDADEGAITKPQSKRFSEVRKGFTSFRENDVIMAKITPCMENGKAAIARNLINGQGFGSTEFHVFRTTGAVLPEFIYHFIRQHVYRRAAEAEMTGSVGQKRVPQSFLEATALPLPPLTEQVEIIRRLTELLSSVKASRAKLRRVPTILKRLRQAVLAAACSGRLTEDWRAEHPTIESGHKLAERSRSRVSTTSTGREHCSSSLATRLILVLTGYDLNQPGIEGSQQVGGGSDLCHARIKPQIVAVWIEDHGHAVVNGRGHGIRGRGENRAGLNPVAIGVFPTIPKSRKRKQLPLIYLKAKWLFGFPVSLPLVKTVRRDQAPARFHRMAERGLGAGRFRSCVDHFGSTGSIFRPRGTLLAN